MPFSMKKLLTKKLKFFEKTLAKVKNMCYNNLAVEEGVLITVCGCSSVG